MNESRKKEIIIPSNIESVDRAVIETVEFASGAGFPEEAIFAVDMAVREAVANAVKHGNQADESKNVVVTVENLPESLEVTVRDYGAGFDINDVPDPTDPANLLKASGRGILFMRNFMEEVEWTKHADGGTIVKMKKMRT